MTAQKKKQIVENLSEATKSLALLDVETYYKSLKQVRDEFLDEANKPTRILARIADILRGISIGAWVLSIFPILPMAITYFLERYSVSIWSFNITFGPGPLIAIWLFMFIITMILFFLAEERLPSNHSWSSTAYRAISPDQITFLAAYESHEELRLYLVSNVESHIRASKKALLQLVPYSRDEFVDSEEAPFKKQTITVTFQTARIKELISTAEDFLEDYDNCGWFEIDPAMRSNLQALIEFPGKIFDRLQRKEELTTVLKVLESLLLFTFAFLPEHQTHMSAADLESLRQRGSEHFKNFVERINHMTTYSRKISPNKREAAQTWLAKLKESGYSAILARFTLWFFMILGLTGSGIFLASLRFTLTPDTMATLVIGSSVAGAATLTAILPKDLPNVDDDQNRRP